MFSLKMLRSSAAAFFLMLLTTLGVYLFADEKSVTESRSLAQTYQKQGNYRDAWQIYEKLAVQSGNSDTGVVHDLQNGIECLQRLNRISEMDEFRDAVLKVHKNRSLVLWKLAESYIQGPHYGYIINGEFTRGHQRGGGRYINTIEQDRLIALKLTQQAIENLKQNDNDLASDVFFNTAEYYLSGRQGRNAWKLQILTDLTETPDYESVGSEPGSFFRGGPSGSARG